jgi:hypothetical protein
MRARVAPEVILKPSQITSQPISTSATQWLPVPITTSPVMKACNQPPIRIQRPRTLPGAWRCKTIATHSAQPACSDGKAASWLVRPPRPLGAEASPPHHPSPDVRASTSAYPPKSRGGAVGSSRYATRAMTVLITSALRAGV